jgi:hypothetical protein
MRRLVFGVASILLLTPIAPAATSIVPPSFERLVAEADLVFEGEVIDVRSQFVNADGGQAITTDVSFRVVNVIKGSAPTVTVLEFLGGTVGTRRMVVDGMPHFKAGDHDILFVNQKERLVSPLVGFNVGRFRVAPDAGGVNRVYAFNGTTVPAGVVGAAAASAGPMSVDSFTSAIAAEMTRQRSRGQR